MGRIRQPIHLELWEQATQNEVLWRQKMEQGIFFEHCDSAEALVLKHSQLHGIQLERIELRQKAIYHLLLMMHGRTVPTLLAILLSFAGYSHWIK